MGKPFPRVAPVLSEQPFDTTGTSLYVTAGSVVQYRRPRPCPRRGTRPGRGTGRASYTSWPKTLRRDFVADPETEFEFTLPAELVGVTIAVDVRRRLGARIKNARITGAIPLAINALDPRRCGLPLRVGCAE